MLQLLFINKIFLRAGMLIPALSLFNLEKYDAFQSLLLLDAEAFMLMHVHLVRLTAQIITLNDRWSAIHVGTVVIRCRSRAARFPDLDSIEIKTRQPTINRDQGFDLPTIYSESLPFPRDRQTSDH